MNLPQRIIWLPRALILGLGRWIVGARRRRSVSGYRIWSIRFVKAGVVAWLFFYGPGGILAPRLFGFSAISHNDITIYYENDVTQALVTDTIRCAMEGRIQNLAFWKRPAGGVQPIDIYLCDSLFRWQQLTLSAGGNAAVYGSSIFVSPLAVQDEQVLRQVLTHEVSHVFLNQRVGYLRAWFVPTWINEGVATYVGQNFWATEESLFRRLHESAAPRLVAATGLRTRMQWRAAIEAPAERAALTYGHAHSLCANLIETFGTDRVINYLDNAPLSLSPEAGFKAAFGLSIAQADDQWLAERKSAGQIPQATAWEDVPFSVPAIALSSLPYALIAFAMLWFIRQVFLIARFISARYKWAAVEAGAI
jgi:hypothetical protein